MQLENYILPAAVQSTVKQHHGCSAGTVGIHQSDSMQSIRRLANGYAVTLAVVNDTCSRSPMDLGEALHRSKCDGVEL